MTGLFYDIRYALRQLRKNPGFTIVAVLTLALGIGANTAVFSALNALLLKLLPVRDPQRLYIVTLENGGTQPPNTDGTGDGNTSFSYPVFEALRQQHRIFTDLIAHVPLGYGKIPVRYGNIPIEKAGVEVSGNYFSGLGVPMWRGLGFNESDERNHSSAVVLSYGFWTDTFSRDPNVIGKTLYIKGVPFTITGVAAPKFFGVKPGSAVDFWIPLQNRPELNAWGNPATKDTLYGSPKWWAVPMLARLAPGVTPEQATQAAQSTFWQASSIGLGTIDPRQWPAHLGFRTIKGIETYSSYQQPVEIMMALVGLVLLIACTNVALLILARNAARQREFALRMAVGASSFRLFRQLLAESLLLVAGGASLGWILAVQATRALAIWSSIDTGLAPDRSVLIFTLLVASLAAVAFGLAPLWTTLRIAVEQALKSNSQNASQSRVRVRGGNAAIALQIAMCLTLLVASSLTVRSLLNYEHLDLGMQADRLLIFDVNPQGISTYEQAYLFYQRLLERARAVPGAEAASLVNTRPGSGWETSGGITLDGVDMRSDAPPHVSVFREAVGPDFFSTLGIPILQGRGVTEADTPASPHIVVVNETFAKRFLKNGALGHRLGDRDTYEIVGVAKDSTYDRVREKTAPVLYYPLTQDKQAIMGQITAEVRAHGDPMALLPDMRLALHDLAPDMPLQKPMTQAAQFAETYVTPTLFARLALCFGLLALVMVATGLYGTLAYRVQRRTSEIGIRMALGAVRANVLWMILRESTMIFAIGIAIGFPMAWAAAKLLRTQLYQLNYLDPASFILAGSITLAVTLTAAFIPARKASLVEPTEALRSE
jgi:predicted permease